MRPTRVFAAVTKNCGCIVSPRATPQRSVFADDTSAYSCGNSRLAEDQADMQ